MEEQSNSPMSASRAAAARPADQQAGPTSTATSTPRDIIVRPISATLAKPLVVRYHYLHCWPGAVKLTLGAFAGDRLCGVVILGAGSANAHRLVEGASSDDCITLSRLWLADELPRNSESHVIGQVLRALRRYTSIKFVVSYADPSAGHMGVIYQATNWLYTGLSATTPLVSLNGSPPQHSRTVAQRYGTRSTVYLREQGISVELIPQGPKHRYVFLLDRRLRKRLTVAVLPYPKFASAVRAPKESVHGVS